jgi:hypothetical protein
MRYDITFRVYSWGSAVYNFDIVLKLKSACATAAHCRWRRASCGILVVQSTVSSSAVKSSELSTATSWYGVLLASSRVF